MVGGCEELQVFFCFCHRWLMQVEEERGEGFILLLENLLSVVILYHERFAWLSDRIVSVIYVCNRLLVHSVACRWS